jgi:hypothetical protein
VTLGELERKAWRLTSCVIVRRLGGGNERSTDHPFEHNASPTSTSCERTSRSTKHLTCCGSSFDTFDLLRTGRRHSLEVVSERRVRGAVERTLVLCGQPQVGPEAAAAMTIEDHRGAFVGYVAALLGDFDRYLAGGDVDLVRDGVVYRIAALWLDDDELQEMARGFVTFIQPWLDKAVTPARKRRILRTVLLPGDARHGGASASL